MNPEGEVVGSSVPLPVRLFRTRLDKLLLLQDAGDSNNEGHTATVLTAMLAVLPEQNTNVRPHLLELQAYQRPEVWTQLTNEQLKTLRNTLAPLCQFMPDVNLDVMTFERRMLRPTSWRSRRISRNLRIDNLLLGMWHLPL